jgi:hypothetical protein
MSDGVWTHNPGNVNRILSIGLFLITLLCSVSLISCGGGSSAGPPPPPPPPAGDFSIVVEVPSVTIQQGGALQGQGIQATLLNGFTGTISLTLSGLPAGITATPPGPFSLSGPGLPQVGFQLAASTSATIGNSTVTVIGTSGAITHSVTFPLTVIRVAPFSIHVSPTAVSLTPGTSATVQVSLTANSGTAPQLFVGVSGPPNSAGINMVLPQGFLTPTNPVSFFINPTSLAQPLQNFPVVITAADSPVNPLNSSVFTLPLTVSVPFSSNTTPTRSTFVRTDQSPAGMVYDRSRRLLFASVEILNEVLVLSSVDGHQVASIPVNFPAGIDEAADGSAVYVVSPYFGGVTIIDPNLFQVIGHASVPKSVSGSDVPLSFFSVDALSNGKVMFFLAARDAFATLPPIYLWDPKTDTFANIGPPHSSLGLFASTGLIQRSADHSKVLLWNLGTSYLYDAVSNTFSAPTNSVSTSSAISPDGSRIVSVAIQNSSTILLDSNFNVLASLQLDIFPLTGVVYSLDGKHIYAFSGQGSVFGDIATVIDAQTFSVVGLVPGFSFGASLPFSGQSITTFAIDESNMLFGAAFRGVGFLDMSAPTFLKQPLPGSFLVQPQLASLSSPTQAKLNGVGFSEDLGHNLFVGAPPASPTSLKATNVSVQSANFLNLTIPKGTAAGPANATLTRSDGFFEVVPDAVTFGPTILRVDADAGSPSGNDSIRIVGYGFDSPNTQVTIGGRSTTIVQTNTAISEQLFPTESIILRTPPGTPGKTDVTITTPDGSTSISGGFHYLNSVQVYPIVGALDALTYDQKRQRLYVTNEDHNRIDIFDLATSKFLSPVPVGKAPTALALTPDGNLLAVVNRADGTVSVVDPVKMQVNATYPALTAADSDKIGCGGVVLGISPAAPHRMLVDLQCTTSLFGGLFHLLNLDAGSLTCNGVAGCGSNGIDISFDLGLAAMASTPDGNKIFLAGESGGGSSVAVGLLDLTANTLKAGFTGSFSDAAVSADGTVFAADFAISDAQLNRTSNMAFEPYADSGSESLHNVAGVKLNASGSLLFFPQDSGVDIFDVHTGRLVRHVVLPERIPLDTNALALNETGGKMFLISNSGITIAELDEVPLSLATVNPSSGLSGTTVTLRGSGFQGGATVKFGGSQASTTFVDSNTLRVTVPSLSAGPVRVTVANPDGDIYTLDDAFTIN